MNKILKTCFVVGIFLLGAVKLEAATTMPLGALLRFCKSLVPFAAAKSIPRQVGARDFNSLLFAVESRGHAADQVFIEVIEVSQGLRLNFRAKHRDENSNVKEGWAQNIILNIDKTKRLDPLDLWRKLWADLPESETWIKSSRYMMAQKIWKELETRFPELLRNQDFPDLNFFVKYGHI